MGDFEEKLNAILSSPETMAQVMSIAQSLGMGGEEQPSQTQTETPPSSPPPPDLGGLFSQIDPGMISRLLPLIGELNSGGNSDSGREQLLCALRPFLKESRRDKIDKAMQMAKLVHLGKKFLGTLGDP